MPHAPQTPVLRCEAAVAAGRPEVGPPRAARAGPPSARRRPERRRGGGTGSSRGARRGAAAAAARLAALLGVLPQGSTGLLKELHGLPASGERPVTVLAWEVGLEPGSTIEVDLHSSEQLSGCHLMVLDMGQVYALSWFLNYGELELESGNSSQFTTHWRAVLRDRVSTTFRARSPYRDVYSMVVYCERIQDFTLRGTVSMVNPWGEHLSVQEAHMPDAIGALSVLFLTAAAVMAPPIVMIGLWLRRRLSAGMHHAIVLAILTRGLTLFCWGCDRRQVSRTGASPLWSSLTWQVLDKCQHVVELLVFLLFSFGWKFFRSELTWMEVRVLMYVAVSTFHLGVMEVICVAIVVGQEDYPLCPTTLPVASKQVAGSQLVRHLHDSLLHVVIILATSFHLQTIRAQLMMSPVSWELGKLYRVQLAYERFRWIFLGFLCAPLAENIVKVYFLPWYGEWLYIAIREVRRLAIYVCMSAVLVQQDMPSWGALESIGAQVDEGGSARRRPSQQLEMAALGNRAPPD